MIKFPLYLNRHVLVMSFLESVVMSYGGSRKQIFRDILRECSYFIRKMFVLCIH